MTPPLQPLEWVRPPQQARSAQTLERLLDAAEELIVERGLDGATVAEVARRAESSVGSFYNRFPDKQALLRCVADRFYRQAVDTACAVLDPARWHGYSLRDVVESCVAFLVDVFVQRRRLIRAISLAAADDPDLDAVGRRLGDAVAERVLALLDRRGETLDHPEPEVGVRVAVWLVLSALHAHCLHDDAPPPVPPRRLAAEITSMCLLYLHHKES
ncbi:MAG: TetR/AcrR family transcriptional regulator [Deltaproteobacteria bacterium]|nr:MAG: TetR/AcrR family transcriptional regulator [Deltaproteobacteria bacterium]